MEGSVDPETLVGKWIPNVVGKVFETEKGFVEEVRRVTGSAVLDGILADVSFLKWLAKLCQMLIGSVVG